MPLPLLDGRMTSLTPSASLQRRRTSPGMSLNSRNSPSAFQTGPSVKVKPVPSCSTSPSGSTSAFSSPDFTTTDIPSPLPRDCADPTGFGRSADESLACAEAMPNVLDSFRLDDRVAIVTGGNQGLGEAFARALGQAGARVAIAARDETRTARVAGELGALPV